MDVTITITSYILPIDCLLIALVAHMFSYSGIAARDRTAAVGPWARGACPYPLWLNICASRAINRQSISNI